MQTKIEPAPGPLSVMDIKPIRSATPPSPVEKVDPSGCKEGRRERKHDLKQRRSDVEQQGKIGRAHV
mgnify:CR=1 FL=1